MIIAIDLDGVVFDSEEFFRTYAQLYDFENVKNGLVCAKEMDVHKRFGWNDAIANDFYNKYTAEILSTCPLKPGAKFVIDKLKQMGHTLICITLRGYYRDCEISITEERLKKENIFFDKIFYKQTNKVCTCKSEKIDLIVEDNPNNINSLAKNNIKCLYFKSAGIKDVRHSNVAVVQNWADILEKICKLEQ